MAVSSQTTNSTNFDTGDMPALAPMLRRIAAVDSDIAAEVAELDDEALRNALYPVTKRYAYLNHAATGSISLPVERAIQRFIHSQSEAGSLAFEAFFPIVDKVRAQFAALIGADSKEIAFTKNVSDGLNIIASGLHLGRGDTVVTAETEFPTNVYPWLNLRSRGVEVRFVPARNGRILPEDIAATIDEHTRLVSLSFVEFGTGYRNDLAEAARLAHAAGALFCVDGIQGLGALQLDVAATGIDFLATGTVKWLLGPANLGLLYIRPQLLDFLKITTQRSWLSVPVPFDLFNYAQPLRPDAARLEGGSNNMMGIAGLSAALAVFAAADMAEVEARVLALADLTRERLTAEGHEVISPDGPQERSGIVCFRPRRGSSQSSQASETSEAVDVHELTHQLAERQVVVSPRNGLIRVAPHFYNIPADIERLIQALP